MNILRIIGGFGAIDQKNIIESGAYYNNTIKAKIIKCFNMKDFPLTF